MNEKIIILKKKIFFILKNFLKFFKIKKILKIFFFKIFKKKNLFLFNLNFLKKNFKLNLLNLITNCSYNFSLGLFLNILKLKKFIKKKKKFIFFFINFFYKKIIFFFNFLKINGLKKNIFL
jgi:hypothetical protein